MDDRKKVGLALSGGGIRGLAHIGVLRALEKYNIPIDFISGTSMGAVVGALYSAEPNAKKLEKEILKEDISDLFDYTLSKAGFVKGDKIERYLKSKLGSVNFEDLKIKLFVTSYDIKHNREVIFSKGDIVKATRASISFPGLFIPVKNKNEILVDGGVIDPLPTEILKKAGADIIIAVNVNFVKENKTKYGESASSKNSNQELPSIIQVFLKSEEVINARAAESDLEGDKADMIINIPLGDIGLLDYTKKKKAIEAGKRYSQRYLKEIKSLHKHSGFIDFIENIQSKVNIPNIKKEVKKVEKAVKKTIEGKKN
ncbi:MAG TPA: patatin-like phospholipase family protein [Candidatus Nanoarchaeia archaeon]|nr:patatin-like phospholipase family protein [Candidatus Nanoarchaeia archaeon]